MDIKFNSMKAIKTPERENPDKRFTSREVRRMALQDLKEDRDVSAIIRNSSLGTHDANFSRRVVAPSKSENKKVAS